VAQIVTLRLAIFHAMTILMNLDCTPKLGQSDLYFRVEISRR